MTSVTASLYRGQPLTAREIQIVTLIANGHTNDTAGAVLQLSGHTVKNHLRRAMVKTGARSRAHVAALCLVDGHIPTRAVPKPPAH